MPDVLSQDDSPLSFMPGSPMLAPPPPDPMQAPQPVASGPLGWFPSAAAPAPPGVPNLQAQIQEDRAQGLDAINEARKSMAAEEAIAKQRATELEPRRQKALDTIDRSIAGNDQALAQLKARTKERPEVPKAEHADENWLFAASILGSLAGAFTRNHATNALAAFSGAMQGYNEGNKQKIAENMKIWEAENKRVQETNQEAMDEYKAILNNNKLSIDQQKVALELAGMKYDDQAAIQAARTKGNLVFAQYFDKRAEAAEKMQTATNALVEKRDEFQQKQQQQLAIAQMRALGVMPGQANDYVSGIASYDIAPPTGARAAAIMNLVKQENPAYDQKEWQRRLIESKIPAQAAAAGATARARVLNTAGAQTEITLSRAGPVLSNAAEAANRVPATEFKRINELYQTAAEEISDPAVRNFKVANEELAGLLAAVNNPRSAVITVSAYEHARQLIQAADGPEAYQEVLQNIARLATRENESVENLRKGGAPGAITIPPISPERRASVPGMINQTGGRLDTSATSAAGPGAAAAWERSRIHLPDWLTLPKGWTAQLWDDH